MRIQNRARTDRGGHSDFSGEGVGVPFFVVTFEVPLAFSPILNCRTMNLMFNTPLKGNLVLCGDYREACLLRRPGLYKFVWVRRGGLSLEIDHIPLELHGSSSP